MGGKGHGEHVHVCIICVGRLNLDLIASQISQTLHYTVTNYTIQFLVTATRLVLACQADGHSPAQSAEHAVRVSAVR